MYKFEELYERIEQKIRKIDFSNLWPGFKPYEFALYTSEFVYLKNRIFETTDQFRGNTSIEFEGKNLAIWNVEDDYLHEVEKDEDVLAANIIHEMFHAFQNDNNESRFPNDIIALDYPMHPDNFNLKTEENKILAKAFKEKNKNEKRKLLSLFCGYRETRESIVGDIISYEYKIETVEGMAEYVGLKALEMLSKEKYDLRMKKYTNHLETVSSIQFDIRRISYYSGMVLLNLAFDCDINMYHNISHEKQPIYLIIAEQLYSQQPSNITINSEVTKFLSEKCEDRRQCIHNFFEKPHTEFLGSFIIAGYDPMNMFKIDGLIYGKHFWRLQDKVSGEYVVILGESVLHTNEEGMIDKYWKVLL